MRCTPDVDKNIATAEAGIREAAQKGAQLICLPELFRSLYFCQTEDHANFKLAEPIPGPTSQWLSALAKELQVVIAGSLFERRAAGVYHNTSVIVDVDGTQAGIYRKMHIPDDPLYYEKFYFTPGDLGFQVIETSVGKIGTLVCWDQWFPEAARLAALGGADILIYPTAIGWHPAEKAEFGASQQEAWQIMQRSHAIANGLFVLAINRVGHEGDPKSGIEFWGTSFVADPSGKLIAHAATDSPTVLIADCDLERIETTRQHWPFLRDRRIDAYGSLLSRVADGAKKG